MEENFIQERLEKLSPYFRGIIYDQNEELYVRILVMIPKSWNYKSLKEAELVLSTNQNEVSNMLTLGVDSKKNTDVPVDFLLNSFSEVIDFNKKEEKKRKLLQKKIAMLERMTLEEIEGLTLPIIPMDDIEETNDDFLNIPQEYSNYVNPMVEMMKKAVPVQQILSDENQEVVFTPLYQNNGKPMVKNIPIEEENFAPKPFDDSFMFQGDDFIPDDPEEQRLYYQREQERLMELARKTKHNGQQPQMPLGRERMDNSNIPTNGVGYNPMPNLLDNIRDNY